MGRPKGSKNNPSKTVTKAEGSTVSEKLKLPAGTKLFRVHIVPDALGANPEYVVVASNRIDAVKKALNEYVKIHGGDDIMGEINVEEWEGEVTIIV